MVILPLYNHVKKALSQSEFVSSDGEFLTGKIFEAIESLDKTFLSSLLKEQATKEHFFDKIDDIFVLNQNKLFDFFDTKEYDSSFTSFKPKIGLIRKDSFIKKFDDTVLAWPYKDCILEGGMSSEDAGKKEVFYNTIISKDEIDRLFEPKVLTNIRKYSREGESVPSEITLDDNLILKGNNLLALHSLKKRYIDQNGGMIKLIYIDPPYNTGNDGFKYNDRFNHSTWLTFMKNRLEVARELLRDDGVIFVSIDDNEQAYLKVLMDEVFGRDNFISSIIWHSKYTTANDAKYISNQHENIHFFAKNKSNFKIGLFERTQKQDKNYKNPDNDPKGKWKATPLHAKSGNETNNYTIFFKNGKSWTPPKGCFPRYSQETLKLYDENNELYFNKNGGVDRKTYLSEVKQGITPGSIWSYEDVGHTHQNNEELANLLGKGAFNNPKGTTLIKQIIKVSNCQTNDIILDFHAGSGTTAHAVLDLNKEDGGNRKFILIEQMDYIETVTSERVKKVIDKNGEGSFVYAELRETDDFNETDTIGRLNDNMRYLPISEIDDESYGVSDEEKRLNKQFYGIV